MGGTGGVRAILHMWIKADGYKELITHVFDEKSEFLDGDAVFGLQRSLIRAFAPDETYVLVRPQWGLEGVFQW